MKPSTKKHLGIWTGPAWEKWDLNSYRATGIGGSETCAGRLAQTAAQNGYRVTMFGEHERASQDGVELIPHQEFEACDEYFDVFIASRSLAPINQKLRAGKVLVWVHDCALISGAQISEFARARVDAFVCLSDWHAEYFANLYGLSRDEITISTLR